LPEALVVSSYFAGHGIYTALDGYHHASMAWHCLYALDGIRVSVLDIDFDRAGRLLDQAPSSSAADAGRVGRDAGRASLSDIGLAVVALLLVGVPFPVWLRRPRPDDD
jgi:hypothetical protein